MSHPDEGVLQALLDEELAPAETAEVQAHFTTCTACEVRLAELKALMREADGLVGRLQVEPLPAARPQSVPARGPSRPGSGRWLPPHLLGIAASLLVAVTAGLLLRPVLRRPAETTTELVAPLPTEALRERAVLRADDTFRFRSGADTPAAGAVAPLRDKANSAKERRDMVQPAPAPQAEADQKQANGIADVAESEVVVQPQAPAPDPARDEAAVIAGVRSAPAREGRIIDGLTPDSLAFHEPADGPGLPIYRAAYTINGTLVVLEPFSAAAPAAALEARPGAALTAAPRAPAKLAKPIVNEYRWELNGDVMLLKAALPVDSLAALARRVK